MAAGDIPVWEAWIAAQPGFFEAVEYDVRVGPGAEHAGSWAMEHRVMIQALTQKRVDVVGLRRGELWVCEVKPRLSASAIGQALSYAFLVEADRGQAQHVVPAVIVAEDDPQLWPVLVRFGIVKLLVGEKLC
jgi:hypothetical protein